jgi:disulfide bond formation protein DsbB
MASAAQPASARAAGPVLARLIALLVPAGLLGGAMGSQYIGGLAPCEMCYWQRWPHAVAIILAGAAFVLPGRARLLTSLAGLAIAVSGAIGVFHAGVELGWWEGLTRCTAGGAMSLEELMNVPLVRCDQVQWSLLGISMAGWNAIISLGSAALIWVLVARGRP